MKIDEKAEREAFQAHWCPEGYDEVQDFHIHKQFALDAWLARAAQPVRVSREALLDAFNIYDGPVELHVTYNVERLRALGIEVIDA